MKRFHSHVILHDLAFGLQKRESILKVSVEVAGSWRRTDFYNDIECRVAGVRNSVSSPCWKAGWLHPSYLACWLMVQKQTFMSYMRVNTHRKSQGRGGRSLAAGIASPRTRRRKTGYLRLVQSWLYDVESCSLWEQGSFPDVISPRREAWCEEPIAFIRCPHCDQSYFMHLVLYYWCWTFIDHCIEYLSRCLLAKNQSVVASRKKVAFHSIQRKKWRHLKIV